jgi:hypothetical protein
MAPQLGRIFLDEIGAQQIAAFAQACLPQFVAIEAIAESGCLCGDLDRGCGFRGKSPANPR